MNLVGGEVGADILPKFLIPDIGLAGGQEIGALGADVEVDNVIPLPGTVHLRPGGDSGTAGRRGGAERYAVLVKQNVIGMARAVQLHLFGLLANRVEKLEKVDERQTQTNRKKHAAHQNPLVAAVGQSKADTGKSNHNDGKDTGTNPALAALHRVKHCEILKILVSDANVNMDAILGHEKTSLKKSRKMNEILCIVPQIGENYKRTRFL